MFFFLFNFFSFLLWFILSLSFYCRRTIHFLTFSFGHSLKPLVADPLLMMAMLPDDIVCDKSRMRWAWCAEEICFPNAFATGFMRLAKVMPIARGDGIYQLTVADTASLLQKGDWLHVFPEGRCITDGSIGAFRWGVGKLIADCEQHRPLVVPFVHSGMTRVMPLGSRVPRPYHRVSVLVGGPIEFGDLFERHRRLRENNEGWGDPWPPQKVSAGTGASRVCVSAAISFLQASLNDPSVHTPNLPQLLFFFRLFAGGSLRGDHRAYPHRSLRPQ
jgi:1-acyl-sn-glycerol-3-phosphate acyltransferase